MSKRSFYMTTLMGVFLLQSFVCPSETRAAIAGIHPQTDTINVYVELKEKAERPIYIEDPAAFFADSGQEDSPKETTFTENRNPVFKRERIISKKSPKEGIEEKDEAWAEKLNAGLYPRAAPPADNASGKMNSSNSAGEQKHNINDGQQKQDLFDKMKDSSRLYPINLMVLFLILILSALGPLLGIFALSIPVIGAVIMLI